MNNLLIIKLSEALASLLDVEMSEMAYQQNTLLIW